MLDKIDTDLPSLIEKLPPHIQAPLEDRDDTGELLEIVLDLGREPEARLLNESFLLDLREVTEADINYVLERVGSFGEDNRAGIERTLHRISAIRNRKEKVVGLTLRVGRAVYGTIRIIEDLVVTGKGVLLVGKPGVGKTTMLREVARVLSDDAHRRTIVVDTSNEIAGDGDIPHPGIGRARRMQVPTPAQQHAVMIEAVENHMPEVIVIDEIGTKLEADAARTIAERGVQLVATAHGNTLENLVMNPTLSDLVGGVQAVTLGDDEARRRRTQKTVLERVAPPTFEVLVEIQGWNQVSHPHGRRRHGGPHAPGRPRHPGDAHPGRRRLRPPRHPGAAGRRRRTQRRRAPGTHGPTAEYDEEDEERERNMTRILPYGVNKDKLAQAVRSRVLRRPGRRRHPQRRPPPDHQELLQAEHQDPEGGRGRRQARLRAAQEHPGADGAVPEGRLPQPRGPAGKALLQRRHRRGRGGRRQDWRRPGPRRPEPPGGVRPPTPSTRSPRATASPPPASDESRTGRVVLYRR